MACLLIIFQSGRLAMPSTGYENVRHATLLFCAEGVNVRTTGVERKGKEKMSDETGSAVDEQIKKWAEEYERLFGSSEDDVTLSDEDQIPPDEMRQYIDNYRRWFCEEVDKSQLKQKLAKLKKVREGWTLNTDHLDKIISYIENILAQV